MAPEQFRSYSCLETDAAELKHVTMAVDVYSYGCVLWEILTGAPYRCMGAQMTCPTGYAQFITSKQTLLIGYSCAR